MGAIIHHLEQNSAFKNILRVIEIEEIEGISKEELFSLFDLVDYPQLFDCLLLVVENIVRVCEALPGDGLDSPWETAWKRIFATTSVCQNLLTHQATFLYSLPDLGINLNSRARDIRKSSLQRFTGKAPVWANLGNLPIQEEAFDSYFVLLAQLWLCYILMLEQGKQGVTDESLRLALGELWHLASEANSNSLKQLPKKFCPPDEYCTKLRLLSIDLPVHDLVNYLEDVQDILFCASRLSPSSHEATFPEEVFSELVKEELCDDYGGDESDPPPIPFLPVTRKTFKAFAATEGVQIRKRLARENQRFPFALNMLSERATKDLLRYLSLPGSDLQGRAILALAFWGAMDVNRLSYLSFGDSDKRPIVGDYYDARSGAVFLQSPYPILKNPPRGKALMQLYKRQTSVEIPLPDIAIQILSEYTQSFDRDFGRLFLSPVEVTAKSRELTRWLRKTTGSYVTAGLVRNYLPHRLSRTGFGDPAFSDLAFGLQSYLGRTKVYYAAFDHYDFVRSYRELSHSVLLECGMKSSCMEAYPEGRTFYVGTPKRPALQPVQHAFSKLPELIHPRAPANSKDEFIQRHNYYVAYTVLLINYCTGFRSVTHPYIDSRSYDPVTGFCGLGDKDSTDGNRARPLWLSEALMKHLEFYRYYLRELVSGDENDIVQAIESKGLASLFFLSSGVRLSTQIVRPKTLAEQFEAIGYHVPLNSQRHFLKSELQEDGCPPDVVELFLGHFEVGEEGYSPSSALHPHDYKSAVEKYLSPLLRKIGLRPLEGPPLPEDGLVISLGRLPKDTSARQKRKMRRKQDVPDERRQSLTKFLQGVIPQKTIDSLKKDQLDVLIRAEKHFPALFHPFDMDSIPIEKFQKFYAGLGEQRKEGKVVYKQQRFFRWLAYELTKGSESPCRLPKPLFMPPEKNLIRAQVGFHLSDYRALEHEFIGDLEKPLSADRKLRLGQVLLSGILFGGLLNRKWVEAVPRALQLGVHQVGDLIWLDLWDPDGRPVRAHERFLAQMEPDRYRRWLPDSTSQLLIYRWLNDFPGNSKEVRLSEACLALCAYLNHLGFHYGTESSTLNKLLRIGSAAGLISWPPVVVAYAKGLLPSASLPTERWLKIVTGKKFEVPAHSSRGALDVFPEKGFLLSRQLKLRKQLCQILAPQKQKHLPAKEARGAIEEFVANRGEEFCSILQLLVLWALFLLNDRDYDEHPHHKKTALRNTTVAGYLGRVGDSLIRAFRWKNPKFLDVEEMQEIYGGLTESLRKSRGSREAWKNGRISLRVIRTINMFHWFLEVRHQVPYEAVTKLLKTAKVKPRVRVRAQLVLPQEYREVLCSFDFLSFQRSRLDTVACCILILAYRTGLRLAEILGLRLQDICPDSPLDILVRRHGARELKTSFSKRRIPSYLPIPEDELELLRSWFSARFAEAKGGPYRYLFTANELANDMLIDHELIPQILKRLKDVTGDSGVVLHGCRHSFYSSIALQLLTRDDVPQPTRLAFADQLTDLPEKFEQAVRGNTATGRNKLHAAALLVGHSDVATGMFSYFHLSDWLLNYSTRHPVAAPRFTAKALAALMGVSKPQAYNILRNQGYPFAKSMSRCVQKYRPEMIDTPSAKVCLGKRSTRSEDEPDAPTFSASYEKLKQWHKANKPCWKLPKTELQLVQLERWHGTFCDRHKSTRKKLSRLARFLLQKTNKFELYSSRYQDARDLLWWLGEFGVDSQCLTASYCQSRWADRKALKKEYIRWQEKIPSLSIGIGKQRVRRKKGIVRITINPELLNLLALIGLIYDHDSFDRGGGVSYDP